MFSLCLYSCCCPRNLKYMHGILWNGYEKTVLRNGYGKSSVIRILSAFVLYLCINLKNVSKLLPCYYTVSIMLLTSAFNQFNYFSFIYGSLNQQVKKCIIPLLLTHNDGTFEWWLTVVYSRQLKMRCRGGGFMLSPLYLVAQLFI